MNLFTEPLRRIARRPFTLRSCALVSPAEHSEGAALQLGRATTPNRYRPVRDRQGHLTGAGAPRGLYVMQYVGPSPDTDDGWRYGTMNAAGRITSEGRLRRCMDCHRRAPHGRLFGNDG